MRIACWGSCFFGRGYDIIQNAKWDLSQEVGGQNMSLRYELSADWHYVNTYWKRGGFQNQTLQEAAVDILRRVIAPTFRTIHYESRYRKEEVLTLKVDVKGQLSYTVNPYPDWDYAHTGASPEIQTFLRTYHYTAEFPKEELWRKVIDIATEEEWQIEGEMNARQKEVILTLHLR